MMNRGKFLYSKIGVRAMMGMSNMFWNFLATKSLLAYIIEIFLKILLI